MPVPGGGDNLDVGCFLVLIVIFAVVGIYSLSEYWLPLVIASTVVLGVYLVRKWLRR